ncbi:hypothetical protein BSNK01_01400 [Bacillaceae bacterium]
MAEEEKMAAREEAQNAERNSRAHEADENRQATEERSGSENVMEKGKAAAAEGGQAENAQDKHQADRQGQQEDGAGDGEAGEAPAAGGEREKQLLAEIEEWKRKAEENYHRFLRAQADFENFRRRVQREKEEMMKYRSQQLIEALLPVVDNFERALAASKETTNVEALAQGIEMVFRQMEQILHQEGVVPIEAVGKPFDPHYHQAVMQVQSEEHESGVVVEELQKGYMLKDRVIRPSMVKVSS